jgi:hypothetical protein
MDKIRKEDSLNVFVFNGTALGQTRNGKKQQPSELMFTVQNGGGQSSIVRVPKTWVPINIGLQVSKSNLFEDSNFLMAVSKGMLKPITNAEAMEFFQNNEEASGEFDQAMSSLNRGFDALEEIGMANFDDVADIAGDVPDGVSPAVANIVARFNEKEDNDLTEEQAYSLIRNINTELTKIDIDFMINNINSGRIQGYLNKINKK